MRLAPVSNQHIEWIRQKRNLPELMKYFRQNDPITEEQQLLWWKNLNKENVRLFIISVDEYAAGYIGLNPIDWRHKNAEFGIFIIPEYQGKGVGKEALITLLKYGFEDLKLHKIYSDVLDYPDENRFAFYKNIGFMKDGVRFQHYLKDGSWVDSIEFSMIENEYRRIYVNHSKDRLELRKDIAPASG